MQTQSTSPPKYKIALAWLIVFGGTIGIIAVVFLLRSWGEPHRADAPDEQVQHGLVFTIIMAILGGLALLAGFAGYAAVLLTNCLTFNFSRPYWAGVKGRLYAANIVVKSANGVGLGLLAAAFATPWLAPLHLSEEMAFMLPVIIVLCLQSCAFIWINLWAPLEKRLIDRRLLALGIRPEQRQGGSYVGLSNPAVKSELKRFGGIEEDIGMLWVTPQQLIYWGDHEQFSISREQLVGLERKADAMSVTMLSGTAHNILHVAMSDGITRHIRLHDEGIWTMGGKRRAADAMAARIQEWHSTPPTGAPVAAPA